MTIEKDVSALSDTDLAEMITKLRGQMTNLEAAQAAFSKIGQQVYSIICAKNPQLNHNNIKNGHFARFLPNFFLRR